MDTEFYVCFLLIINLFEQRLSISDFFFLALISYDCV